MPTLKGYDSVAVGTIQAHGSNSSVPLGYLLCDGATVSRTTYARLFDVVGTSFGEGNGSTTFHLPDFRGRFLRGKDGGAGTDPEAAGRNPMAAGGATGNNVGSIQGDMFGSHGHALPSGGFTGAGWALEALSRSGPSEASTGGAGGSETRPKNAYVNYIIKY